MAAGGNFREWIQTISGLGGVIGLIRSFTKKSLPQGPGTAGLVTALGELIERISKDPEQMKGLHQMYNLFVHGDPVGKSRADEFIGAVVRGCLPNLCVRERTIFTRTLDKALFPQLYYPNYPNGLEYDDLLKIKTNQQLAINAIVTLGYAIADEHGRYPQGEAALNFVYATQYMSDDAAEKFILENIRLIGVDARLKTALDLPDYAEVVEKKIIAMAEATAKSTVEGLIAIDKEAKAPTERAIMAGVLGLCTWYGANGYWGIVVAVISYFALKLLK